MVKKEAFLLKVSEIVNHFFQTEFSVRPTAVRIILEKDILIIKLSGIISLSEKELTMTREGDELINKVYKTLFDRTVPILEERLKHIAKERIKSSKNEVNTKDMECFCIFSFYGNIENEMI
jgi:uncharacterized protein YbcI